MQAILLKKFGGPEVLSIREVETPIPNPEQLLVQVKAAGVNRADLLQRRGKYPPPPGESDILGLEIAGVIEQKGKAVQRFKIGDRVCGLVGGGGYAEYCLIDQNTAMPIPDSLSFIEAAAIPEGFLTANEAVFTLGELKPKECILIHAGGSGVGTAAIQLAHYTGAYIITTVGSQEKLEKLRLLNPNKIINYKIDDFASNIKTPVDVVIDFIGASYFAAHLHLLNMNGRLIQVGTLGGSTTEIDLRVLMRKRLQIKGLVMRVRSLEEKQAIAQSFIEKWLPLLANKTIAPIIDSVYPLKQVRAAHERMENNANFGKIILEIS